MNTAGLGQTLSNSGSSLLSYCDRRCQLLGSSHPPLTAISSWSIFLSPWGIKKLLECGVSQLSILERAAFCSALSYLIILLGFYPEK